MARREILVSGAVARLRRLAAACAAACLAMWLALGAPSLAQDAAETEGARLYRQHCASCHGVSGRGDGPVAARLKTPPTSLTTLARRHGGTFPTDYVVQIVDGRQQRRVHGGRNMPVWGTYFGLQAQGQGRDAPDTETAIRQRITALIAHLETLQVGYTASAPAAEATATGGLLARHLAAVDARDRDAVMAGYGDDSVLVLPTGVLHGTEQIGDYYESLFTEFGRPGATFTVLEQTVVGNVARIVWRGETADTVYEAAEETIAAEGGKIRYQIVAFRTRPR